MTTKLKFTMPIYCDSILWQSSTGLYVAISKLKIQKSQTHPHAAPLLAPQFNILDQALCKYIQIYKFYPSFVSFVRKFSHSRTTS